ncbi:TPA: hypothetical protein JBF07_05020 [Legionella pneumophila]|nr:hypothetical protein [Legionella pneumophila]
MDFEGWNSIVMDNAAFHKSEDAKRVLSSANCNLLFLPPHSPALSPIGLSKQT